ncbi:MAG: hypothetical protein JJT78_01880 [Leptospira sp.]|nr:hypothetical protein [Leptospira sp.]
MAPEHPKLKENIDKASLLSKQIVIVDMVSEKFNKLDSAGFRREVLGAVKKIKKYDPSIIYIDNAFIGGVNSEEFSKELNLKNGVVSHFVLTENEQGNGHEARLKSFIHKKKISGVPLQYKDDFFTYNGVVLPNNSFIELSRKICFSSFKLNKEKQVTFIHPYHRFDKYLLLNCPVVIANEILEEYKLEVSYDPDQRRFLLFSYVPEQMGAIKYIDDKDFLGNSNLKINFKKFQNHKLESFLDSEGLDISPGSLFILVTDDQYFETNIGEKVLGGEIMASQVYTILQAIQKPLNWRNSIILRQLKY